MLIIYHQGTTFSSEGPRFLQNVSKRFYLLMCMQFTLKMKLLP